MAEQLTHGMKRCIVSICGDAGGSEALAPVVNLLNQDGHQVESFTYRQGPRVFQSHGIANSPLEEEINDRDVQGIVSQIKPDLMLTATSFGQPSLETRFIIEARRAGLPVLSVLDYWSNYDRRFAFDSPDDWPDQVPDKIAIMDELAYSEMLQLGFPDSCLEVTGQPAFDGLSRSSHHPDGEHLRETRKKYSVKEEELLVLFLSSPVASHQGTDASSPDFIGYTEHTALALLLAELECLVPELQQPLFLLVKPHPREPEDNHSGISSDRLRLKVVRDAQIRPLIAASDLIIGMFSVALVESCLLGKPTISLQPELIGNDLLPSNRWGASRLVNDPAQLSGVLRRALESELNQKPDLSKVPGVLTDGKCTNRVAHLALSMIGSVQPLGNVTGLAPHQSGEGA